MDNLKEQILQGNEPKKPSQEKDKQDTHAKDGLDSPWVKATGIFIVTVGLLWGSSFFFSALGASVRSFKKMLHSFKE